jgi:hypothetical protein
MDLVLHSVDTRDQYAVLFVDAQNQLRRIFTDIFGMSTKHIVLLRAMTLAK